MLTSKVQTYQASFIHIVCVPEFIARFNRQRRAAFAVCSAFSRINIATIGIHTITTTQQPTAIYKTGPGAIQQTTNAAEIASKSKHTAATQPRNQQIGIRI